MNIAKHSLIKVTKSLILRNAAESNLVIRHSTAAKSCCCGFVVKMPGSLVKISLKETDFWYQNQPAPTYIMCCKPEWPV